MSCPPNAPPIKVTFAVRTDVGQVRAHNEDSFLAPGYDPRGVSTERLTGEREVTAHGLFLAVCDGMGGASSGELASEMAVQGLFDMLCAGDEVRERDDVALSITEAIHAASRAILQRGEADRRHRGMGTTAVVAGLVDEVLLVALVGDSRGYLMREGKLTQLTRDQTLAQKLIELGQLRPEDLDTFEHSNVILQALGTGPVPDVDTTYVELRKGDVLLLCSDGLTGMVRDAEIEVTLGRGGDLGRLVDQLVELAIENGGYDNITCQLARFDGDSLKAPSPDDEPVRYRRYPVTLPSEPPESSPSASVHISDAPPEPLDEPPEPAGCVPVVIGVIAALGVLALLWAACS